MTDICPLLDVQKEQQVCSNCMYYIQNRDPPCVFKQELAPMEFARLKGFPIEEMHAAADRIKTGIALAAYAEHCKSLRLDSFVGPRLLEVYELHPSLALLDITPSLFQAMCDKALWKEYKAFYQLKTSLTALLGISREEFLSIISERETMKLRGYTLAALEQQPDRGPVYVVNRTVGEKRGDVFLTVARTNGTGNDSVNIPATWIPVDLTSVVNRRQLLEDNNFRKAVTVGMLQLVHPDDAMALFEQDDQAKAEFQRIAAYLIRGGMATGGTADLSESVEINRDQEVADSDFSDAAQDDPIPTYIRSFLNDIQLAHEQDSLTDDAVVGFCNRLRNFGSLPVEVLKHVFRETKAICPKVAQTAKGMRDA